MKRLILILIIVAAMPLFAQAPIPDSKKPVATINGETITVEKLDHMYARLSPEMRENYDRNGGKGALLDNYIRKRLIIQEALKKGYDKRPDVAIDIEMARESALFDRYVRDVVAQNILTNELMQKFYEENLKEFATPETFKVRHIFIGVTNAGPRTHSEAEALDIAKRAMSELRESLVALRIEDKAEAIQAAAGKFGQIAMTYSEDGSAAKGGDLGWVQRGQLDPDFEQAVLNLRTGVPSGIVRTRYGYHIIFVEGKRPAGSLSFEEAKPRIREVLMNQFATDVLTAVNKLTNELTDTSKISVYPENIK